MQKRRTPTSFKAQIIEPSIIFLQEKGYKPLRPTPIYSFYLANFASFYSMQHPTIRNNYYN